MPREIRIARAAERELASLPVDVQARFERALDRLAAGEIRPQPGLDIKRLQGRPGLWRLRVGRFRGIFEVDAERIVFTKFGDRSAIYRP